VRYSRKSVLACSRTLCSAVPRCTGIIKKYYGIMERNCVSLGSALTRAPLTRGFRFEERWTSEDNSKSWARWRWNLLGDIASPSVGGSEDAAAAYAMTPIRIIDPFKRVLLSVFPRRNRAPLAWSPKRKEDEPATRKWRCVLQLPRRSPPFPHFVAVLRRIAPWPRIPNVGTAFSMFVVTQTKLQIVKANSR